MDPRRPPVLDRGGPVIEPEQIRRFRQGDPDAFAAVVDAFDPLVRGVVRRLFASTFEQDEAMQEIWLHLFRRREAVDVNRLDAFPGWVAATARHRAIDYARQLGRSRQEVATADLERELQPVVELYHPAEAAALRAAVQEFKAKLKGEQWRRFFELHFEKELSVAEASSALGLSVARGAYLRLAIIKRGRRSPGLRRALGLEKERRAAS